jgi:hypothetical protein
LYWYLFCCLVFILCVFSKKGGSTSSGATLIATQSFTGNPARNELSFKKGDRLTVLAGMFWNKEDVF